MDRRILDRIPMRPEVRAELEARRHAERARESQLVTEIRSYLREELAACEITVSAARLRRMSDQVLAAAIREVTRALEAVIDRRRPR
jgi:hypothetical protein